MTDFIPKFPDSPALQEFRLRLAEEYTWLLEEIQKKNLTIKALTEERDELVRMTNKLTAERDEARRSLCHLDEGWPFPDDWAREKANELGWDCFKEN